jgi:glycogen debranching enzyme
MTDLRVRPDILYAWKGPALFIVNTRGECGGDQALSGFYYREARFLRTLRLEVNGHRPWLCEAAAVAPDRLEFTYVHPDVATPGGGGTGHSDDREHEDADGLPERALDVRVTCDVRLDALNIQLTITNRAMRPLTFAVSWALDADFADIQEALSGTREQQAVVAALPRDGCLELRYDHPRLPYRASVHATGGEWRVSDTRFNADVSLAPQQSLATVLRVVPSGTGVVFTEDEVQRRETLLRQWTDRFTRVEVAGRRETESIVTDSIRDFASFPQFDGEPSEWLAPQAGVPLYPAFFGRDALTAGWQAACIDQGQLLDASLARLSRLQSRRTDDWHDEEPGRLPYQVRQGPLALLDLNPYAAYYADYASPLMFVISLANLVAWTGDMSRVERYWDTARRILDWARDYGDRDRDGYLEYQTRSPMGTKNQGWKDSGDAIVYPDGSPVPSPIATCEIQAYWYVAQELMAALCWLRGDRADAAEHRRSAASLKERFNRDWWVHDDQFFAMALDPAKHPVRGATSNVGHCLACGIIDADHLPPTVGRLFAPDMFSGWGIRTLSSDHAFYNPLSYHRGTVWAVEQATILFGLRRFRFTARMLDLAAAIFELAALYPDHRIPECIGGYARSRGALPGAYPRANTPQLWNATVIPLTIQTMLGLLPLAPLETLVVDPLLPDWLPEITIRDLRVAGARVTLHFRREPDGASSWEVLEKHGTLRVLTAELAGIAQDAAALFTRIGRWH